MGYVYEQSDLAKVDPTRPQEWYLPDGLGGYSAGTITNRPFRKHLGYFVQSLNPPTDRTLLVHRTDEWLLDGSAPILLSAFDTLHRFRFDAAATYRYEADGIVLEKTVAPRHGGGATVLLYRILSPRPIRIAVLPLFAWRNHGDVTAPENAAFGVERSDRTVALTPPAAPSHRILCTATRGVFRDHVPALSEAVDYGFDAATGDTRSDRFHTPIHLEIDVPAGVEVRCSLTFALDALPPETADAIVEGGAKRLSELVDHAGVPDDFARRLVAASDLFLAWRASTRCTTVLAGLPWFADWGRDTMIAFEGLVLTTRRFAEAREILSSFARYERDGLLPNMFPDAGNPPIYNTADAALWYVHAVSRYLEATGDAAFVRELFPTLERIVHRYEQGTAFAIGMDADGLMRAGSGIDQVTWMDVRVDGVTVTPRHGKPVEINALWYNALRTMATLSVRFGRDGAHELALARKVRRSFLSRFWNVAKGCLYDVVDPDDASIRPNMLYAASLPYTMLPRTKIRRIVDRATVELLDVYGLRSLSRDDPRFVAEYTGPLRKRDFSYHMGTTWGFLIGTYVDAYLRAYPTTSAKRRMRALCRSFETHLREGAIGGVAEIFDGLGGTISRGCSSQAWSVAELLRVYVAHGLAEGVRP